MNKTLTPAISLIFAFMLMACGSNDSFRVVATIDGLGTQNIKGYYRSDGKTHAIQTTALDGSFQLTGSASEPTLISFFTNAKSPIVSTVVKNGDNVELSYSMSDPASVRAKGASLAERFAKFQTEQASLIASAPSDSLNDMVQQYVFSHSDDPISPLVMLAYYDTQRSPLMADSMVNTLSRKGAVSTDLATTLRQNIPSRQTTADTIPAFVIWTDRDAVDTITPKEGKSLLIAITDHDKPLSLDTLSQRLNTMADSLGRKSIVVALSLAPDTAAWHALISPDTKTRYKRAWMAGGVAAPGVRDIAPKTLPWYLAADSAGATIYQGPSLDEAYSLIHD